MERPHARFRASQAFQTEHNLAKQPAASSNPAFPSGAASPQPALNETRVVELPERQPLSDQAVQQESIPSSSKRRSVTAIPRQSRTPTAKRKLVVSFRRLWETNQHVFTEDVRQLEAYVERINRVLAERANRQAELEQWLVRQEETKTQTETQSWNHQAAQDPEQPSSSLTPSIEQSPQLPSLYTASKQETSTHAGADGSEMRPDRVSCFLAESDTLMGGETLVNTPPADESVASQLPVQQEQEIGRKETNDKDRSHSNIPPYSPASPALPTPSVFAAQPELYSAAQAAARTAEALRYLASRESSGLHTPPFPIDPTRHRLTRRTRRSARQRQLRFWLKPLVQLPRQPIDKLMDGILWVGVAAGVRVGAQVLLAAFPALAPLVVLLMIAPAAIAVYLALFVRNAGLLSVYRLFLVMVGLLLGGRL